MSTGGLNEHEWSPCILSQDKEIQLYDNTKKQACKLKSKLRELTSCLCSAPAMAVCFEGRVAGLNATETGNELSQPT